jgi:hypothetical protein
LGIGDAGCSERNIAAILAVLSKLFDDQAGSWRRGSMLFGALEWRKIGGSNHSEPPLIDPLI